MTELSVSEVLKRIAILFSGGSDQSLVLEKLRLRVEGYEALIEPDHTLPDHPPYNLTLNDYPAKYTSCILHLLSDLPAFMKKEKENFRPAPQRGKNKHPPPPVFSIPTEKHLSFLCQALLHWMIQQCNQEQANLEYLLALIPQLEILQADPELEFLPHPWKMMKKKNNPRWDSAPSMLRGAVCSVVP